MHNPAVGATISHSQSDELSMDGGDLRHQLRSAGDLNRVCAILDADLKSRGFEHWKYEQIYRPYGRKIALYSNSITAEVFQHLDISDDPLTNPASRTIRPFVGKITSDVRHIGIDNIESDFNSWLSLVLPLHGPRGNVASFHIFRQGSHESSLDYFNRSSDILHLTALEAHERIISITNLATRTDRLITRRQVDILYWVARGKTNWEIGQLLSIKEDTVRQHLIKACKTLGASNRTHAAIIGLLFGLISL